MSFAMLYLQVFLISLTSLLFHKVEGSSHPVVITNNGPIVQGATITFRADIFESDGSRPSGSFRFHWTDLANPPHINVVETEEPNSTWQVTYPSEYYYPGPYEVNVNIEIKELWWWSKYTHGGTNFEITDLLNGKMNLVQSNQSVTGVYVSNTEPVQHVIALSEPDLQFLTTNATLITTYWFKDCVFYGQSEDFTFNYTFHEVGTNHTMQALVVASYDPITTTAPPQTTTTPQSTTTPSSTTTPPSTTTPTPTTTPQSTTPHSTTKPPSTTPHSTAKIPSTHVTLSANLTQSSTADPSQVLLNHALGTNEVGGSILSDQMPTNKSMYFPYICSNSSIVPPDPKKTYGYFSHSFTVLAPVQNLSIEGTTWLQNSEVLDLQVYCNGSPPFTFCYFKEKANYNVTGNETCFFEPELRDTCKFNVSLYYTSSNYSMVLILNNDVSRKVESVGITIYQAEKHTQLSVIVVPVACCMVAVILIVFGVAYHVQSRKRFTIEVADFDFGQSEGDMEYKTFRERLTEAVVNSLNRDFGMDGENVWSPSRKYGSMQ